MYRDIPSYQAKSTLRRTTVFVVFVAFFSIATVFVIFTIIHWNLNFCPIRLVLIILSEMISPTFAVSYIVCLHNITSLSKKQTQGGCYQWLLSLHKRGRHQRLPQDTDDYKTQPSSHPIHIQSTTTSGSSVYTNGFISNNGEHEESKHLVERNGNGYESTHTIRK